MAQVLQDLFVAVEDLVDEALKEKLRGSGEGISQSRIHPVGGEIPLPGVKTNGGLALPAGLFFAECHHLAGVAPAAHGGMDTERVNDSNLFRYGRDLPWNEVIFRQLDAVQIDNTPERAVLFTHVQSTGFQDLTGSVEGGIFSALPVGVDSSVFLLREDGVVNGFNRGRSAAVASRIIVMLL